MSNQFENANDHKSDPNDSHEHSGMFFGLIAGLVIALAGCGYLAVRVNQVNDQMTQLQENTKTQISSLSAATTSLLEERMQGLNQQLTDIKGAADSTSAAVKQTRALAQRQSAELTSKLEDQQKEVSDQLTQLKDATTTADTKISEVSSDVSNVKTDVNGVKTDVTSVKSDVTATQAGLEKTGADLKRAMGDMGVMSGLIATNSKDLAALRELGERNYTEFDLSKKEGQKKIGNITIAFKKSDPGRNRYTVDVLADDKRMEKKDRTINEPVQLYVSGNRQPYEIVVNQVKRDEIVGYLATPKVTVARQ
jgi:DNA repair exonuclease SbcCD ATPase subunit